MPLSGLCICWQAAPCLQVPLACIPCRVLHCLDWPEVTWCGPYPPAPCTLSGVLLARSFLCWSLSVGQLALYSSSGCSLAQLHHTACSLPCLPCIALHACSGVGCGPVMSRSSPMAGKRMGCPLEFWCSLSFLQLVLEPCFSGLWANQHAFSDWHDTSWSECITGT